MPQVPAFCDNCDLVYASGLNLTNVEGVSFTNTLVQCPRCHHYGRVLDGVYDALGDTIQALVKMSKEELEALLKNLQEIQRADAEVTSETFNDACIGFANVFGFYANRREPSKTIAIITLLCTIINTLIAGYNVYHQKGVTKDEVAAMIDKAIQAQPRVDSPLKRPAPRNRAERRKAKHK